MIAKYLDQSTGLNTSLEDLDVLANGAGIKKICLSHAGSNLPRQKLLDANALAKEFAGQRVLFLTRNFEDTLVSSFFQTKFRKDLFDGQLSDFIRSKRFGAVRLREFLDSWDRIGGQTADFHHIRYEDIHNDPNSILNETLNFCGIEKPNPALIQSAVEFCAFNNLQKMERNNAFTKNAFRARDTSKVETYKFRQGEMGGYKEHMSARDVEFLRVLLEGNTNPLVHSQLLRV